MGEGYRTSAPRVPALMHFAQTCVKYSLAFVCLVGSHYVAGNDEGKRSDLDSDEAGLWMVVDRHEQILRTSNRNVQDRDLVDYVSSLACRTVGTKCAEIRLYVLRAPGFNAFILPNGAMFVQSGLLLRVGDAAELAAVLGHETSHFVRGHSLASMRRWSKTASGFAIASSLNLRGRGRRDRLRPRPTTATLGRPTHRMRRWRYGTSAR